MAHYAELNENNVVVNVYCVNNDACVDENGNECEELGAEHCKISLGYDARLVKTSYNNNIRCRYAGIGYIYNEDHDVFLTPKIYSSWLLNTTTFEWEPPVPFPQSKPENGYYIWSEEEQDWIIETYPPKEITSGSFRSQLTLTEKLLWDSPDTATTSSQKAIIITFKNELPLTEGTEELNELLDLLVSTGVFTQQRLDEIISNL